MPLWQPIHSISTASASTSKNAASALHKALSPAEASSKAIVVVVVLIKANHAEVISLVVTTCREAIGAARVHREDGAALRPHSLIF